MLPSLSWLPTLLGAAWLAPLVAFVVIVFVGKRLGPHGKYAGYLSVAAIVASTVLSLTAMFGVWLPNHPLMASAHHEAGEESEEPADVVAEQGAASEEHAAVAPAPPVAGDWYTLAKFGKLKLTIGYYIDSLTVTMFCMVSFIAACIHIYALGYMHDELHEPYIDHEVTLSTGEHLHRRGRFYRFFQYFSLFSFSMLGLVVSGNLAMVFVFWELVGICSYFLIGFYIERDSASTAANKAFIVNRIGDFGMLIGLMALWASLGTFAFGDVPNDNGEARARHLQPTSH